MRKLAIDGGPKARTTPTVPMYPGGLEIGDEEKRQVLEVLDRKYLFRYYGPKDFPSKVNEFEKALAAHMGVKHCLAVTNCTSALIDALVAVGVGPGDEVIVSGYTFFASCAAIVAAKAVRPARAGRAVDPVVRLLLCMCDSFFCPKPDIAPATVG